MSACESQALHIINLIIRAGYEARMVGGAVRDGLMGVAFTDVDLATTARPEEIKVVLEAAGLRVVPTGIDYGTVTAVMEGKGFEITTLRRDIKTNGRHAEVVYTLDWCEDAQRRDFTINALSRDADGRIYDYTSGLEDIKNARVRFVGDPGARIAEDRLRILRYFRFLGSHGKAQADDETLHACAAAAGQIKNLSRERIWQELKKILALPNPAPVWQLMSDHNILNDILPEAAAVPVLQALIKAENIRPSAADKIHLRRLVALLAGQHIGITALQNHLAMSKAEAQKLQLLAANPFYGMAEIDAHKLRTVLYRQGVDNTGEFLLLAKAISPHFIWDSALAMLEKWQPKTFPLKAADVMALGVSQGPQLGSILKQVEDWWVEKHFLPDHGLCVQKAQEFLEH